ncbi:MAG: hypothetical protein R2828_28340 [Saprospiraceae bacterium]
MKISHLAFPCFLHLASLIFMFFFSPPPMAASTNAFHEKTLLVDPPQFAIPGNFSAPFDVLLNNIPDGGLDLNNDNKVDIVRACSCRPQNPIQNGTNSNERFFDDQLIVATGISNQVWQVSFATNLYQPVTLAPITPGTRLPEIGNTGIYVLKVLHQETISYVAEVTSTAYPGQSFDAVYNTCYYPDAEILNLGTFYCESDPGFFLQGKATSGFDNNLSNLVPTETFWIIKRLSDNRVFVGNNFNPRTLGGGNFVVQYNFVMGDEANSASNKTACSTVVEQEVYIRPTPTMVCNGLLNIPINPTTCEVFISPSIILAGNQTTELYYSVSITDSQNRPVPNPVPGTYANQLLTATVTDECTGLYCSSILQLFDNTSPTISIPPDIILDCTGDPAPAFTGYAVGSDCDELVVTYADHRVEEECATPRVRIERTWTAKDRSGNTVSDVQIIGIERGGQEDFVFPNDVTYTCAAYLQDPHITDPGYERAGLPTNLDQPLCGFIFTYKDDTIPLCGPNSKNFVIIREWLFLSSCGFQIFTQDALGGDNKQIITVEDRTAPEIQASAFTVGANLAQQDNASGVCSSTGYIPPPQVNDACNNAYFRIMTSLGEANYVNGVDASDGGYIPPPGLPIGTHTITYEAWDDCGNTSSLDVNVTVIDNTEPLMICNSTLTVSLDLQGNGILLPDRIDEGSRDECCTDISKIKLIEEPDAAFRDKITFYCTNDTVTAVLRLWDCAGNFNNCQATVFVSDPIPPIVVSRPTDVFLNCQDEFDNYFVADYDAPVFADNCSFTVDFSAAEEIDDCGKGRLLRTWKAIDHERNPPTIVTQRVELEIINNYWINLPRDSTVACNGVAFPELRTTALACDNIIATVTNETFTIPGGDACYYIRRTHQITNLCNFSGNPTPMDLNRLDPSEDAYGTVQGYALRSDGTTLFRVTNFGSTPIGPSTGNYRYVQIIAVVDEQPPVLSAQARDPFCTPDLSVSGDCTAAVSFDMSVTDNCSEDLEVIYSLLLNNQNAAPDTYGALNPIAGGYRLEGNYPLGSHAIFLTIFDDCSNPVQITLPFQVEDCTAPVMVCPENKMVEIPSETELITLQPFDVIQLVEENCSLVDLSFSADMSISTLSYGCDQEGIHTVDIFAMDESGNQSNCRVQLEVVPTDGACVKYGKICGTTFMSSNEGIAGVNVKLSGLTIAEEVTLVDGEYCFEDIQLNEGYKLRPSKDDRHGNGVSTFDIVLISRHIIGMTLLDSPYKIVAADVNRSNTVTTLDIVKIRRVILGLDARFPESESWRFIPANHEFQDSARPFLSSVPDEIIFTLTQPDTIFDFWGVKIGDVNFSALPN